MPKFTPYDLGFAVYKEVVTTYVNEIVVKILSLGIFTTVARTLNVSVMKNIFGNIERKS